MEKKEPEGEGKKSEEIQRLKEEILKEYPRLTKDSEFFFACHDKVACFNGCCRDVNIFLTPYDVLRMKRALAMTSGEFLAKYTLVPFDKNLKFPAVLLKMEDNKEKTCPFVSKEGCRIYSDRPWACRMYPLGLASPKEGGDALDQEFYFLLKEAGCQGFDEKKRWTVGEWMENQGVAEYNAMGQYFKDLTLHSFFQKGNNLPPPKIEMFFMACYDLDKFRRFVFDSSLLDKFEIEEEKLKLLKEDDVELLKFAYTWLRFSLFGEKTMKVKGEVLQAKEAELAEKKRRLNIKNN